MSAAAKNVLSQASLVGNEVTERRPGGGISGGVLGHLREGVVSSSYL
jgi:hypothetical protein